MRFLFLKLFIIFFLGSGSGSGLHKSMTRLPSVTSSVTNITNQPRSKISCSGVTVTTNNSSSPSVLLLLLLNSILVR